MHPRKYFELRQTTRSGNKYKEFRKVCKLELNGRVCIDYRNESTLRALTQMLLEEYFQLRVEFAPGSLVPTLPLRLNYILWLEDLITSLKLADAADVRGIDIGCGSSCIYTLLGARKNSWRMYALESNDVNLEFARSNTRNEDKRTPPHNCHTGHDEELACEGGEVQFVHRIIEESELYPERIGIYTSMLGHKSSVGRIIEILTKKQITNVSTTEFCQGNTTRWGCLEL
ncbi:unnamed protein product [Ceratitis capitata]|uniref:U6 snRNA m(6)A methyltransferase n=1 Tax=Ceratitis capitata TaxID=7213 RepID=A0A811UJI8_CERCA|nr:unnamed protein product [Ceratitis capitata]